MAIFKPVDTTAVHTAHGPIVRLDTSEFSGGCLSHPHSVSVAPIVSDLGRVVIFLPVTLGKAESVT